jgi:hypothetical protein
VVLKFSVFFQWFFSFPVVFLFQWFFYLSGFSISVVLS